MAKKKKPSLSEDLINLTAALPWWVGCILAAIAYFALHKFAITDTPAPKHGSAQIGSFAVNNLLKAFANLGQYLVPLLLLIGSALSILGRKKRTSLVRNVAEGNATEAVRIMSWHDFELFVGELFHLRGYSVEERGGYGADGGVDLRLKKDGEVFVVQCKHWRSRRVPVQVVRELLGVIAASDATGGFVVTSGTFTSEAASFAANTVIELIDGEGLAGMLPAVQTAIAEKEAAPAQEAKPQPSNKAEPILAPLCPRCGGDMILRTAQKGANAGNQFWGCVEFPKCRGTSNLL